MTEAHATVQELDRVFKMGALELPDPDASLTPSEALKVHQRAYPVLGHSTLSEPEVEGNKLVYNVIKPTSNTKGANHRARDVVEHLHQNSPELTPLVMRSVLMTGDRFRQVLSDQGRLTAAGSVVAPNEVPPV